MRYNIGHLIVALIFTALTVLGMVGWRWGDTIGYVWFSGTTIVAITEFYMFFKDDGIDPED